MNTDIEGSKGEVFRIRVENGKIAEFAEATQSTTPAYFQDKAPLSPPTFLTTSFFWEARVGGADMIKSLELNSAKAVHAEQEYQFFGCPPRGGDLLNCQTRVDKVFEKTNSKGKTLCFAELITDYKDLSGQLVAQSKMTIIEPQ